MRAILKVDIYKYIFVATLMLLLVSCDSKVEENDDQRDKIATFLESSHDPKLISQSEIDSSLEDDPYFYIKYGKYSFLYIDDYYNVERDNKQEIKNGSRIKITFRVYPFSGSKITTTTTPVYTNDPAYEESYTNDGLNTLYWNFEPMELTIGDSELLESIQDGLKHCKEGDSIEIYITRNMGYGDNVIGSMAEDSAIVFFCTINSVLN